jgi:NAD(P)-dependent dehydrogenase (short-subunit alcohol dehydrogenase family)
MEQVTGKVAFITGGASGIGLGMARAFLDAGMRVAIGDLRRDHLENAAKQLSANENALLRVEVDVTDRGAMQRAADKVVEVFGKVHVLCNNAGIGVLGGIKEARYADWDWILDVNLNGVFNGVRTFLPLLRSHREGGHIMSTASMGGLMATNTGGVYATAKFGVVAMMECLREDLADENIGVSVLCPAAVNTNIHQHDDMRPKRYSDTGYQGSSQQKAQAAAMIKGMLAMGMDPLQVGKLVLRAIQHNQLYIFTHPMQSVIGERRDALLDSLPAEPVNVARLQMDMMLREMMKHGLRRD